MKRIRTGAAVKAPHPRGGWYEGYASKGRVWMFGSWYRGIAITQSDARLGEYYHLAPVSQIIPRERC